MHQRAPPSSIGNLIQEILPEGRPFSVTPTTATGDVGRMIRGRIVGYGTRGVVFEVTDARTGEKKAAKIYIGTKNQVLELPFVAMWKLSQELAIVAHASRKFTTQDLVKQGLAVGNTVRRLLDRPRVIYGTSSPLIAWNSVLFLPLMKCSLNLLFGRHLVEWSSDAKLYAMKKVISAAANIQRLGLVHSDIHDKNVLVRKDGELLIGDFGDATFAHNYLLRSTRRAAFAHDALGLGLLLYKIYTGGGTPNFRGQECSDSLTLSELPASSSEQHRQMREAIRGLVRCDVGARLQAVDIVNKSPIFDA